MSHYWPQNSIGQCTGLVLAGVNNPAYLTDRYKFCKNIGYALQYLEYLLETIPAGQHATVIMCLQKSFVITGGSILEAILWYTVKAAGLHKTIDWDEVAKVETTPYVIGLDTVKTRTVLLKKQTVPSNAEMTFDSLIKIAKKNTLLVGFSAADYDDLHECRKLRNSVHVHLVDNHGVTDWYRITNTDVDLMKRMLHQMLNMPPFSTHPNVTAITSFLL
jgi:hypothetical protein